MSIRCSVYIAASVDGFIARPNGDVDWLDRPEYATGERLGIEYDDFTATIDTLVMGRGTFDKVLTFGNWPFGEQPVVVLTSTPIDVPADLLQHVRIESGEPREVVARLEAEGRRHLYVDGGITIQRFLRQKLIDDIVITRIPVLLGDGIPLFGVIGEEIRLAHETTTTTSNGFVQSSYRVLRE